MKCLDFDATARALYKRVYRVTLPLTSENIKRAYEVYNVGVREDLGIVEAIRKIYGYRYRRMENFIREIGAWLPGQGWHLVLTTVKAFSRFADTKRGKRRGDILIDATFEDILMPLGDFTVNYDWFEAHVNKALLSGGFYGVIPEEYKVGLECLQTTWSRPVGVAKLVVLVTKIRGEGPEAVKTAEYVLEEEIKYRVSEVIE